MSKYIPQRSVIKEANKRYDWKKENEPKEPRKMNRAERRARGIT